MVAEHGAVPQRPPWRLRGTTSQSSRSEPATPTATVASPLPVPTGPTLTTAYAERLEALAHAVSATGAVGAHSVSVSAGTPPGLPTTTNTNAALSTGNSDQMLLSQMATAQSPSPVMDGLMAAAETTSRRQRPELFWVAPAACGRSGAASLACDRHCLSYLPRAGG